MKKISFLSLIFTALLIGFMFSAVLAQDGTQTDNPNPNQAVRPFKIIQELGLTRPQIQQIRRINQERKPLTQAAQRRWQMARRNLDSAIYADDSTDEQIRELTKQAQLAQSELLKERTQTEYLIRKVLTPEQLVKFRQLREELIQRAANLKNADAENTPNMQPQRPLRRMLRRRNQIPPQ